MILVDTSAWIEVIRGRARDRFSSAVVGDVAVTCLPVMQEVLQGIDDEATYHLTVAAFADIPIIESPMSSRVFDQAVQLYRAARRSGYTLRSSADCLIAACALRNDAVILHVDRDFTHLERVAPVRTRRL